MAILSVSNADHCPEVKHSSVTPLFDGLFKQSLDYSVRQLSRLFNTQLSFALINLQALPLALVLQQIEDDKRFQNGVHSQISGDLAGEMFLFFPRESAYRLVQLGLKRSFNSPFLNRLEESVLNELTNILINSFWENFSRKLNTRWWFSPPATLHRPQNVLGRIVREKHPEGTVFLAEILIINTQTPLMLFFLPSQETLAKFAPFF